MKIVWLMSCLLPGLLLPAAADELGHARRLLQVTSAETYYTATVQRQTIELVRIYQGVVIQLADRSLSAEVSEAITECYLAEYRWTRYAEDFAAILAANLNTREMSLLIDFYSAKAIPPREIDTFKDTIAKAPRIEQQTIALIEATTEGCLQRSTQLIMTYVRRTEPDTVDRVTQQAPTAARIISAIDTALTAGND
ncbi:MAG: hypothetical protein WDZ76_01910 [Pseudohongiellaceae bacterium]